MQVYDARLLLLRLGSLPCPRCGVIVQWYSRTAHGWGLAEPGRCGSCQRQAIINQARNRDEHEQARVRRRRARRKRGRR